MNGKKTLTSEQIREILNDSTSKNNNLLIFFLTFGLYILISTLGTTDVALLLPQHGFKMPVIDFELDLLSFFVLGPLLLLLLHFNTLYHHHKHLQKLNKYKNEIDIRSIDPLLYNFAFDKGNHGFEGRISNNILWMLLYILPLLVFLIIYINFSDYHHAIITPLHLGIIIFDLIFIVASIHYNNDFYNSKHNDLSPSKVNTTLKYIFYGIFTYTAFIMTCYFFLFFCPITYKDYDPSYLTNIKNNSWSKHTCYSIKLLSEHKDCYPRLVVTEEEMAKISPAALYIPRVLAMDGNISDEDKEKKLILKYGTRINLANRNLRYADLQSSILTRANMRNCQLDAANLMKSHMQAVDLTDANLTDANLMLAKLQFSYLYGAQLQRTNLVGVQMQNVRLDKKSNFTNAKMQSANLSLADFSNANLRDINLGEANLTGVNFFKTNLVGASFVNAKLINANLTNANLTNVNFFKANLTKAQLYKSNLVNASFVNAKLTNANLTNANLTDVNFFKANLTKAQFNKSNLVGASFSDANLTSVSFQDAILVGTDFTGAYFTKAKMTVPYFKIVPHFDTVLYFKYAQIQGFNICNTELKEEKADNWTIPSFKNAQLQGANLCNSILKGEDVNLTKIQKQARVCAKIPAKPAKNDWIHAGRVEYMEDWISQINAKEGMAPDEKNSIINQVRDKQCKAYIRIKKIFNFTNKKPEKSEQDKIYLKYLGNLVESYKEICSSKFITKK